MSFNPASSCPSWCDPRLCSTWPSNRIHLSTPIEFEVNGTDDKKLSIGLERRDEIGMFNVTGDVTVLLTIEDTASCCHCGKDLTTDVSMSTTNSRFLMASLGVTVDKLEALLAVTR